MRGGHDGVLGEGVEVGVQFWEESPDGDLLAPGLNRFGDRVPAGSPRTTITVEGVEVPTLEVMALPTVDDVRFDVDVVYTWVDGDDEDWLAARDARITGLGRHAQRAGRRRLALPQPRRAALLDAQPPPLRAVGAPHPPGHRRPGAVVARHLPPGDHAWSTTATSCPRRRCRPSARTRSRPGCTPCPTSPTTSSTSTTTSSSAGRDAPSTSSPRAGSTPPSSPTTAPSACPAPTTAPTSPPRRTTAACWPTPSG